MMDDQEKRRSPVVIPELDAEVEPSPEPDPGDASAPSAFPFDGTTDSLLPERTDRGAGSRENATGERFYGVYPALVVQLRDPVPPQMSQVGIRLPWLSDDDGLELWARYAGPASGHASGAWFLPDIGDEVLVAFEGGDLRRPYVLGGLWNGRDVPPETLEAGAAGQPRSITTRGGARILLEDGPEGGRISIETPWGHSVLLATGPDGGETRVRDAAGSELRLGGGEVTIQAPLRVTVAASTVELEAGMVDVRAGLTRFTGVVQCDTLITNSVVSSSYTPGAGNVW